MVPSSVFTWEKVVDVLPYIQLDYYKMLEMIGSYIGKENITVRVFDRKRFLGNTIYADFMHCVGLEYTDEYKVEEEIQNISLTKNNIEIKRILNTLPELDERNNNLFRQFLSNLSEQNPEEKKYDMFSLEEREAFMVQYREGNQKIENEFLNGEQLFSLVGAEEKWIPTNEKMYADTILLFGTISLKLLHENENLRKELKAQKQEIKKIKESLKHPFRAVKNKMFK